MKLKFIVLTLLIGLNMGSLLLTSMHNALAYTIDAPSSNHIPTATNAAATPFIVTTLIDTVDITPGDGLCEATAATGDCSLRAAIMEANALAGADVIILPTGGYSLTIAGSGEDGASSGDLDITSHITIIGDGTVTSTIDGRLLDDRIFHLVDSTGANLTLHNLAITRGSAPTGEFPGGGGILNNHERLTLNNVFIMYNKADDGGGIFDDGYTEIRDSFIFFNTARTGAGGGIFQGADRMLITGTLIRDNFALDMTPPALGMGGGIFNINAVLTVTGSALEWNGAVEGAGIYNWGLLKMERCAFIENMAHSAGGGLYNVMEARTENCTFSENIAGTDGGGVFAAPSPIGTFLTHTTFHHNEAGGGGGAIFAPGTTTIFATILDSNTGSNCTTPHLPLSLGYNLDDDTSCSLTGVGDISGMGAMLAPLASNNAPLMPGIPAILPGGALYGPRSHALAVTSPAIDKLPALLCPSPLVDQRVAPRPIDGDGLGAALCDIGAFEYCPPPIIGAITITYVNGDIGLTWADNSANTDGYKIWRHSIPNTANTLLATLPTGTTSYTDTAVSTHQPYFYTITSHNACGDTMTSGTIGKFTFIVETSP